MRIIEMTDEEKLQMYRNSCTFDELARMHIELEKHIPKPQIYQFKLTCAKRKIRRH